MTPGGLTARAKSRKVWPLMKVATRWSLIVGSASAVCLSSVAMFLVYPTQRLEPGLLWLAAGLSITPVFCLVVLVVALVNSTPGRD